MYFLLYYIIFSLVHHLVHNSATLFLAPLPSTQICQIPTFDNYASRISPSQDGPYSYYPSGYQSFPHSEQSAIDGETIYCIK